MKVKLVCPWVVNRSVEPAGTELELPRDLALKLERQGRVERDESEWETVEDLPVQEVLKDVLIFTPVYRLEPETIQGLLEMEFEGALSVLLQRDNPVRAEDIRRKGPAAVRAREAGIRNHLHQYQRARAAFLAGTWQAMLVIESDIIPPRDTLRKLAALNADVAYGVYRFRVSNVINIFERYPDKNGRPARNVGESLSVRPWVLRRAVKERRYPCSGAGLGVVLIRRKVLEAIEFRREHNHGAFCDTWFTEDVLHAGFSQRADMTVVCGHKDGDGTVYWPELPGISVGVGLNAG